LPLSFELIADRPAPIRRLALVLPFVAFVAAVAPAAAQDRPLLPGSSREAVCTPAAETDFVARLAAGLEGESTCCTAHGGPGCDDAACSDLICFEIDPVCCTTWDEICAGYANSICDVCGGSLCPGTESCCQGNPNKPPKCDDPECCGLVCNLDPTCCAINWDSTCRNLAVDLCSSCGGGSGDCCTAHAGVSCSDEACALAVCQDDSFCCEFEWDEACVTAALEVCSPSACPRTLTVVVAGSGTGTVTGTGIACPADCSGSYDLGAMVTITAAATGGSTFAGWSGDAAGCGTTAACELTMDADRSATATFDAGPQTLNVTIAGDGTGTVTDGAEGDISCSQGQTGTCTDTYPFGSVVNLTATPSGGATFTGWSGEAATCGTTNPCAVTLSEQRDVTASFQSPRTLNVTTSGGGSVTDTSPGGTIDCPGDCTDDYDHGTTVTLAHDADAGWIFAAWTGEASGCGGDATCAVSMTEQRDVGASFQPVLTVSKAGGGSGTVTDGAEGDLACGATCSESYPLDTEVTLTATPTAPAGFGGWSGDGSGTTTRIVTMSGPRAETATFDPGLAVTIDGDGSVADATPGGTIACPADCADAYTTGASVSLAATAGDGSSFAGWTGDCTGDGSCDLTMSAYRSVTAHFDGPHSLSVSIGGDGTGSVADTVPGGTIACPGDCGETYDNGESVSLTAAPTGGAVFTGWSGDCSGTSTCELVLSADRDVTANFAAPRSLAVTVEGDGTVADTTPSGTIDCPGDCAESYAHGTSVTLEATPTPPATFSGWSGDCAGTDACNLSMTAARDVTATFASGGPDIFHSDFETGSMCDWSANAGGESCP
jgi:hypothetical protein